MLAIVPDYDEDDDSSCTSESTCELESISSSQKYKVGRKSDVVSSSNSRSSQGPPAPGALPDLTPSCAMTHVPVRGIAETSVGEEKSKWTKEQIKKFLDLHEKRLKAAEEKVPEGYRRQRRRKRRNNQAGRDHNDSVPNKQPRDSRVNAPPATDDLSPAESSEVEAGPSAGQQDHWDRLKGYLDVNAHISQGIDHGQFAPDKSGLEKRVEEAIAEGDFERAERLSEELSKRDLGCRIAKAADARDYIKWKAERDEEKSAKKRKKKKKLAWSFEVKNRWEMKANM